MKTKRFQSDGVPELPVLHSMLCTVLNNLVMIRATEKKPKKLAPGGLAYETSSKKVTLCFVEIYSLGGFVEIYSLGGFVGNFN